MIWSGGEGGHGSCVLEGQSIKLQCGAQGRSLDPNKVRRREFTGKNNALGMVAEHPELKVPGLVGGWRLSWL